MEPFVIKEMMQQEFQIKVYTGASTKGEKLYQTTPLSIKGYYVGKTSIIMDTAGQQVISSGHFYVTAEDFVKITPGSQVTLPLNGGTYPVLSVTPFYKENNILAFGVVYLI